MYQNIHHGHIHINEICTGRNGTFNEAKLGEQYLIELPIHTNYYLFKLQ